MCLGVKNMKKGGKQMEKLLQKKADGGKIWGKWQVTLWHVTGGGMVWFSDYNKANVL
jgi:hypothetical protein